MQVLLAAHKQQLHAAEIEQLRNCLDVSGEPAMEVGQATNMLNQTPNEWWCMHMGKSRNM